MPIAQIIVAPDAVEHFTNHGQALVRQLGDHLLQHLRAAPKTLQITVVPSLLPPVGCDILCLVHHRGSQWRSAEVRATCAEAINQTLRAATGRSVRVRLIAVDPDNIAAKDSD